MRPLQLRKDIDLKFDKTKENVKAALAQARKVEPAVPYTRCSKDSRPGRPFLVCVQMPRFFDKACANCRYGSSSSSYDFHRKLFCFALISSTAPV